MEIVWIDIETSGLDMQKHQIIQVAMVATNDDLEEVDSDAFKMSFSVKNASPDALKVVGYSPQSWDGAIGQMDGVRRMVEFFGAHAKWIKPGGTNKFALLGGHNIALFDAPFIRAYMKRAGVFCPATLWTGGQIDTMQMARSYFFVLGLHNESLKLGNLCQRFGIRLDNAHDALADVRATIDLAKVLKRQMSPPDSVVESAMQLGGVV